MFDCPRKPDFALALALGLTVALALGLTVALRLVVVGVVALALGLTVALALGLTVALGLAVGNLLHGNFGVTGTHDFALLHGVHGIARTRIGHLFARTRL